MTIDFLIIGQGLAGSLLAWELINRGCNVIIVDNGKGRADTRDNALEADGALEFHGIKCGAQRKDAGIDPVHIDAKRARGLTIHLCGTHHQPCTRSGHEPPDAQQNGDGGHHDEQLVSRKAEPRQLQAQGKGGLDRAGVRAKE